VGWQAAAVMGRARDQWINGARPLQFQRLHWIANNVRFLILPGVRVPHLALRVLGLALRRLSGDWQAAHGHALLLAETFVDPERFAGTCYRAANWRCLGRTRFYARHAGHYLHHGRVKTVWVYPLRGSTSPRAWPPPRRCPPRLRPCAIVEDKPVDDLFTVKANQPSLDQDCQALPDSAFSPGA
jgi:hypothetical protein